jgi:acetyl esterase/lipase
MPSKELTALIDMLAARERPDNPTISERRDGFARLVQQIGCDTKADVVSLSAGGVPAEWVAAADAAEDAAILYLHGGAYVIGSIATHRELAARISIAAACRVLVIDYRLAPEDPYPAAVEDAASAYRWLVSQGFEPSRLAIAGDSAGGGLAMATLVSLRDSGTTLPACAVCISPWVDLECTSESMISRMAVDPMIARQGLVASADLYLHGADPRSPLAAPLYADLHDLPPLLIQVGTRETLLDDSTRLADCARAAGVQVELEQWEEMIHIWPIFAPVLPEGQQAIDRIGEFVRRAHTAKRVA